MARPEWFIKLIEKFFHDRFALAKLTNIAPIGLMTDKALFEGDDLFYLPGDRTVQIKQEIQPQQDIVLPSQVVDYFIDKSSYHWVMNFCICRESSDCMDFPIELGCLFLGEAVLGINQQHGRLVSKEEAFQHAALCREMGLIHLIGRNKLDTLWLGTGPGERLMTICNCCPCCCLWKMLPQLTPTIGTKVQKMPGISVLVTDHCAGCGTCSEGECFVDAIQLEEGKAVIGADCRACGRCVEVCPNQAIQLQIDSQNFVLEAIDRLDVLVNLT